MNKKILFIEDEVKFQESFKDIFKAENFEIISAYDGETGIDLAKKERPNLILLDLILPKKNGFEVLKEIKEDEKISNTPVIVLTNLEGARDIEQVISRGANTYLVKANYTIDDVLNKIKDIFAKHESRA